MAAEVEQLANGIIRGQEAVIGPLAWVEAKKVTGLQLDIQNHSVHVVGEARLVLEALVKQYEKLFGPASREVCKDSIRSLIAQFPDDQILAVLK